MKCEEGKKAKRYFLPLDVQILLNNIVLVVLPGNGFIGSLNMKLWGQPEASFDTFQN